MARPISQVQQSPHQKAIESAILDGVPQRVIASRYGVSPSAVMRWAIKVVKPALMARQASMNKGDNVGSPMTRLVEKSEKLAFIRESSTVSLVEKRMADIERVLSKAEEINDLAAWASIQKGETASLRLRAELTDELSQQHSTTVQVVLFSPSVPQLASIADSEAIDVECEQVD